MTKWIQILGMLTGLMWLVACSDEMTPQPTGVEAETLGKGECNSDQECKIGQVCVEGICRDAWVGCSTNDECVAPSVCTNGACLVTDLCYFDLHCDLWEFCDGGVCVPMVCDTDGECPPGITCIGGACGSTALGCDAGGSCEAGQVCFNGSCVKAPVVCADGGPPTPEGCDGQDNDCDGEIDEDFPSKGGPCTTKLPGGKDSPGTFICRSDGLGTQCYSKFGDWNTPEVCDGADNNVNGLVDEDFPVGLPCSTEVGPCASSGSWICGKDGLGVECVPDVSAASVEERCDGVDNDCDGETDEDFVGLGTPCAVGDGLCMGFGHWGCDEFGAEMKCDAKPLAAAPEVCDGVDNDCDGVIDNGFGPLGQDCEVFSPQGCAQGGTWVCGTEAAMCDHPPFWEGLGEEVCDGGDNDCDGLVDEEVAGIGEDCGLNVGECVPGVTACIGGKKLCLSAAPPIEELCDDKDNDCDGEVDEGLPCLALGSACGGDSDCSSEWCPHGACTVQCGDAAACPDGWGCVLVHPGETGCYPTCWSDSDCTDGTVCMASALESGCVAAVGTAQFMDPCTVDLDCASGECNAGKCTKVCTNDGLCPEGASCVGLNELQDYCVPNCGNAPCPQEMVCTTVAGTKVCL